MIYAAPPITDSLASRLDDLGTLRDALGDRIATRSRWLGSLRREIRASAFSGSTAIEGFTVSLDEARELTRGGGAPSRGDEHREALACYTRAMDHVGTMAIDPSFRWLDRVILDLHFEACYFQPESEPGLWRKVGVAIFADDGSTAFSAPASERVAGLMAELIEWLADGDLDADPFVRAAMAHLNLISVHPFRDGNGRISRIIQSLVLAQAGFGAPEFFSIEEYLGSHTPEYYAALREAQGGSFQPERDATGWVELCLDAHLVQARQRLDQIKQAGERWQRLEDLVDSRGWPDRLVIALEQSLVGGTDRGRYGEEAGISEATASADFRRLLDAGLVRQLGRGRNTRYVASDELRAR
ncbi:MAG TPA: Fic family protein [Solirubrobacterales bacterium]|nr:Fic family protein [Solirubrobacterales bacterium]